MQGIDDIVAWIQRQPDMMAHLRTVAALNLPDGWIGAGFIRNAVLDALHGVVYFDLADTFVVT